MENTVPSFIHPFLLMEGGPLYNFQKKIGLLTGPPPAMKKRALAAAFLAFFPLLLLSGLQGQAFGHVVVPFVRDFSTYSRFLLAIPLLILAEHILGQRIALVANHFIEDRIILEKDYAKYAGIIDRGLRARDSVLAELILAIFAYVFAIIGLRSTAIHTSTWYLTRTDAGASLTWAGWWLLACSAPFFQFLVYRWLWRLFLWFQFLSRVRRLDLQLYPTHPDEAAGLGFVGETQRFFGIILFSFSLGSAGVLANDVVYNKVPLQHFTTPIAAYVIIALVVLIAPLALFASVLAHTKRIGLLQYATLATAYTSAFHKKWIDPGNSGDEPLLGTGDIQSLADLGNSFKIIEDMRPLPIDLRTLLHLAVAAVLPLTPLLLAVMPLKQLLGLLVKVLM